MKKILSFLCILIASSTFILNTKAEEKWHTSVIKMPNTTEGVDVDIGVESKGKYYYFSYIKYIINKDYKGEKINLNLGEDLIAAMNDKTYVPGDAKECEVIIVNESNYLYEYTKNSFYISTEDYNKYYDQGLATELKSTLGKVLTFDGNTLPISYTHLRTKNSAIVSLYSVSGTSKVTDEMINDATLDSKLRTILDSNGKSIYNGLNDLDKYYLDFYNQKYNTNVTKLEDFDNKILREIFNGNVNRSNIYETNSEIARVGYNWFYNHLITISPVSINSLDDSYSVGSYMKDYNNKQNTKYEEIITRDFGRITKGEHKLEGFVMNLNPTDIVNAYQNYNFGFTMGLKLNMVNGSVTRHYVDTDGNKIHKNIIEYDVVGNKYGTMELDFDNYILVEIKGDEVGTYIDGNIDVTYIYKKITKNVSTTEESPQISVEVAPPQTGVNDFSLI